MFSKGIWLYPLSLLATVSAGAFFAIHIADVVAGHNAGLFEVLHGMSPADATQIMGGIGEVIAAILGIVITVASIIVQLAATRYTPRITDMFFRDRTNRAVIAFFVVSAVFSLWVNFTIRQGGDAAFVPRYGVVVTMVLLTLSLLVMAPYFNYVFDFLEPDKIVERIRKAGVAEALRGPVGESEEAVDARRMGALSALEHLADIALNAIEQKDKGIASNSVDAVSDLVVAYMPHKATLDARWFQIHGQLRRDPDFVSMNEGALAKIADERSWLEYKALRQFLMVYREALTDMPDIINRIAIDTRYIGTAAIEAGDRPALATVIKFFNTYMRRALNARDVPAAYNSLNQYRYLTEVLLKKGWSREVLEVANHFKYYAQTAQAMKLAFVTETVAFDLCTINELAYDLGAESRDALLRIFLEVDKEAEAPNQESSLRGVRKAQVKLATHYLQKGDEELARRIHRDMKDERPDRLRSIEAEMLSVTKNEFWEINERGVVFEYIEPERRVFLHRFFEWFPALAPRSEPARPDPRPPV